MKRLIGYVALSLTLAAAGGCASSKGTSQSGTAVRRSSDSISAEELAGTGAVNVYDAIQRLRPQWLTSSRVRRGGSGDDLVVYLDSNRYGTMGSLRQLSLGGVQEVRYYGASEATNRYGTGHTGGAILVMMSK
jgi:hypothetical protein